MRLLFSRCTPNVLFYGIQIIALSLIVLYFCMFDSYPVPVHPQSSSAPEPEITRSQPPLLTYSTLGPDIMYRDTQNGSVYVSTSGSLSPPPAELNNAFDSGNENQHSIYVNNLQDCLDTANLTDYFHEEGFLTKAVANVKYYVNAIHRFIPHQFISTLPNHCWKAGVELNIDATVVSGHVNGTEFRVNRTDIEEWTLNTIARFASNDDGEHNHQFLPVSCIPEVFLLGFHKCGSTYIFALLYTHPKFENAFRKEPSWFIGNKHDFMDKSVKQSMYFADYLVNFKLQANDDGIKPALVVDGSVGMILDWPDFFEQQRIVNYCLLPSVIPEVLPRAKFIVVMRDPLSMIYSLFWFSYTMLRQRLPSREVQLEAPRIFHEKVVEKIEAINSCLVFFPLAKCLVESSSASELLTNAVPEHGQVGIYESVYYIHIQKWLSVVPRERFLFLTLEELYTNLQPNSTDRIWKFLGVHSLHYIGMVVDNVVEQHVDQNGQNLIDYQHDPELAMRNDTKEILKRFFHPYNRKLAELLGDRKFLWDN